MRGRSLRRCFLAILVFLPAPTFAVDSISNGSDTQSKATTVPPSGPSEAPVGSKVCRIPALEAWSQEAKGHMFKVSSVKCKAGNRLPLVESNLTSLYVVPEAHSSYYKKSERVKCCWQPFWPMKNNDSDVRYGKICHEFQDSTKVGDEFVKVKCTMRGAKIYEDYHAFVLRKEKVEEWCKEASKPDSNRLSVLIHGLDSVSRLNFHRTMPRTVEILLSLGAVEMLGYNSVAGKAFQNHVPLFSGMSEQELKMRCWKSKTLPLDPCPFIWKNFSAAGYRTIFFEDIQDASFFAFHRGGFQTPPTDYYLHPYTLVEERHIGNTLGLCVGTRKTFDTLIDYSKKVAEQFSKDPYFAYFWQSSLTHDFLNYPQLGDDSYCNFLSYMLGNKLLNNTVLIMMSNYGIRWGQFRRTEQGRLEESLPFVFIVLPTWWRERFTTAWNNLLRNSRSLSTVFDLHETLMHLLNTEELLEDAVKNRTSSLNSTVVRRGVSWFLPVPVNRSCSMAGIPAQYCVCSEEENMRLNDSATLQTVQFVMQGLNNMLKKYHQCAKLTLKTLLAAKKRSGESISDYTLTIETVPGNALLQTMVRSINKGSKRKFLGPVSRLNDYGKLNTCISDPIIRQICYCR